MCNDQASLALPQHDLLVERAQLVAANEAATAWGAAVGARCERIAGIDREISSQTDQTVASHNAPPVRDNGAPASEAIDNAPAGNGFRAGDRP